MPRNSLGSAVRDHARDDVVEAKKLLPERAADRRRRRHSQATREEEVAQRQRDGKKPFYLTLDADGKPYGAGKPAWVAEIGKLATGLDPSCTHIARQTYEAVTTLKARLNQSFDYSGTMNDDYLRSMMGKAVTKKRTELISLIKKGGTQPLHIDREVWERLVKLANSKQREEKSEQGRYANACRKTYGRTGCRGENGIRERLREQLKRSPDPEEMEFEMNRDKGYGGYKKMMAKVKLEKESVQISSDDDSTRLGSGRDNSVHSISSEGHAGPQNYQRSATKEVVK